ncbi:NPC intracellular cholesterol transporter 2-like [Brevipalpus obovatus]|uniref:NPC intracellular cholesterol transporter 2-like n=1 Tax=Brevipalpus obovatus TaxID=246614 RepID=UPI003D9ECC9E
MIRISALVLVLASIAHAATWVDYKPCDNTKPTPQLVQIDACESHDCTLTRGTPYYMSVDFVAPFDTDKVFNITQKPVCGNGLVCPLYQGSYYSYAGMWTPMNFTGSSMTQFSLVDEKHNTLVCFNLPMSK